MRSTHYNMNASISYGPIPSVAPIVVRRGDLMIYNSLGVSVLLFGLPGYPVPEFSITNKVFNLILKLSVIRYLMTCLSMEGTVPWLISPTSTIHGGWIFKHALLTNIINVLNWSHKRSKSGFTPVTTSRLLRGAIFYRTVFLRAWWSILVWAVWSSTLGPLVLVATAASPLRSSSGPA